MKTLYKIIVLTLIAATGLLAAGCRDCPTNGKLDNQWQIMTIEYPDGTVQQPQKLYYCFYRDIVQLTTGGVVATANLSQKGSTLTMEFPYSTADELTRWGLTLAPGEPTNVAGPVYTVGIDHLSDRTLRMITSQGVTISCRKF